MVIGILKRRERRELAAILHLPEISRNIVGNFVFFFYGAGTGILDQIHALTKFIGQKKTKNALETLQNIFTVLGSKINDCWTRGPLNQVVIGILVVASAYLLSQAGNWADDLLKCLVIYYLDFSDPNDHRNPAIVSFNIFNPEVTGKVRVLILGA